MQTWSIFHIIVPTWMRPEYSNSKTPFLWSYIAKPLTPRSSSLYCPNIFSFLSVTSHLWLFGVTKKKFSSSIVSGVVLAPSFMPLHSRKKNTVAYRSSIFAR